MLVQSSNGVTICFSYKPNEATWASNFGNNVQFIF